MGVALGDIGLSRDDFCRLTFGEFTSVMEAHERKAAFLFQTSWQQTRLLAAYMVAPYSKRKVSPTDLFTFDWEKPQGQPKAQSVSKEEAWERFKRLNG